MPVSATKDRLRNGSMLNLLPERQLAQPARLPPVIAVRTTRQKLPIGNGRTCRIGISG
jgi:hypothetical protein